MTTPHRLDADSPLRNAPERSIGLSLFGPLSARVDALVKLVEEHGERTNRKELIAAVILAATADPEQLSAAIRNYRGASIRDTLVDADLAQSRVEMPRRKPGPRPRSR